MIRNYNSQIWNGPFENKCRKVLIEWKNLKNKMPKNSENYIKGHNKPKYLCIHYKAADVSELPGAMKIRTHTYTHTHVYIDCTMKTRNWFSNTWHHHF
jgi:hypothetical protein